MFRTLNYDPHSNLVARTISLAWEGIKRTPTKEHNANICEKLGNGLLYVQENAPRQIKTLCTNPQAITIAVFTAAHLANSYAFYPVVTGDVLRLIVASIPIVTNEAVRFGAWFTTSVTITGYCARAGGRLTDAYIQSLTEKA